MFAEPIALSSSSGINVSKSRVGDTFLLLLLFLLFFFQDDASVILYNIYGGATIQQDAIAPYKGTSLAKKEAGTMAHKVKPSSLYCHQLSLSRTHKCCTTFLLFFLVNILIPRFFIFSPYLIFFFRPVSFLLSFVSSCSSLYAPPPSLCASAVGANKRGGGGTDGYGSKREKGQSSEMRDHYFLLKKLCRLVQYTVC